MLVRDLATIQRRFYELVTAGEGAIEPGLLGASRRIGTYAEMYVARLVDVLADDYPKLRAVLGVEAFHDLATRFVRARPPRSFTIRDAGEALASYLETCGDLPAWAPDLARLERARVEVFDGPDASTMSRDDLAAVPIERFPDVVLAFVPSSMLVRIQWTVDDLWSAIEDGTPHEPPERSVRSVLVWRRDLRVLHRTLDADEAALATLVASRASITAVSARLAELEVPHPEQRMVALLARWLDAGVLALARNS